MAWILAQPASYKADLDHTFLEGLSANYIHTKHHFFVTNSTLVTHVPQFVLLHLGRVMLCHMPMFVYHLERSLQ